MNKLLLIFYFTILHINMLTMGANGIAYLSTKELKQVAKLDIAQAKREGRVVADNGSISGSVDPSKNYYRDRNQYDITQLPTQYSGNDLTDNPNIGGLITGRPWVTLSAGLFKTTYTGYFADDPAWFTTATESATAVDSTLGVGATPTTTSIEWLGYFIPSTTETYTFYLSSDDASYMWIGATAETGYTTANSLINNGGLHGTVEVSATVALTAGGTYPIRIQTGNNGGPGVHTTSFSTPSISKTTTFTGLVFYSATTNGI